MPAGMRTLIVTFLGLAPPHRRQVEVFDPGLPPLPLQVSHTSLRLRSMVLVQPDTASRKVISTPSLSEAPWLRASARLPPKNWSKIEPPPKTSPKAAKM